MDFRPTLFTFIVYLLYYTLCLLYKRHSCIFYYLRNTIQSFSISNMVSELLLWPFSLAVLSLLVLLHSQHRFRRHNSCCSLLPLNLQCLPAVVFGSRPAATIVEESYTAQTTACVITAVNIAPIFCRYHWDRFAPIYTLVEASQPSEIARTLTCHPNILRQISRITRAFTCLHAPDLHLLTLTLGDIICWHHCHHLLTSPATPADIKLLTHVDHTVD